MSNIRLHAFAAFAGDKSALSLAALNDVKALALRSLKSGDRAGGAETADDLLQLKGKARTGGAVLHALTYSLERAQKGAQKVKAYALPPGIKADSRDGKAACDVVNRVGLEIVDAVGVLGVGKNKDIDRAEVLADALALHVMDALAAAWPVREKKPATVKGETGETETETGETETGETGETETEAPAPKRRVMATDQAIRAVRTARAQTTRARSERDAVKRELTAALLRMVELEAELLALKAKGKGKGKSPAPTVEQAELV